MRRKKVRCKMPNSYKSNTEAPTDRQVQLILVEALSASSLSLRRDECGAWRITGSKGHIYTWGDGESWVMYVASGSTRTWAADKKKLIFCHVTQNGDAEGCLRLLGLPTAEQASVICEVLGLRKRRSANQGSYGSKMAEVQNEAPEQPATIAAEIYG
jgi:hypothetical protein